MGRLIDADRLCEDLLKRWDIADKQGEEIIGKVMAYIVTPIVVSQPTANQWIPCSERLPDMHDEVLVTARGEVSIAWLYVDGEWRSNDMPQPMFKDIVAWLPLPEPYKGDEE